MKGRDQEGTMKGRDQEEDNEGKRPRGGRRWEET